MDIESRVINEAKYMISSGKTIREIAKVFGVSKSTVHKDLKERLPLVDKSLFFEVEKILKNHIEIRHIRGGAATQKKYLNLVN